MDARTATAHLDRARSGIRMAMSQWNPADLDQVDSSREILVAAVGDLRSFESAACAGDVPPSADLCASARTSSRDFSS